MSAENGWAEYSKLVLKELATLATGIKELNESLQDVKQEITAMKAKDDKVQELVKWKARVDEVASPTQLKELQLQVEDLKLEDQLKEEKDKFLRLFAEFENYKRRTAKERIELFSTASEEVMISLLPILDDFDRASVEIEKDLENETLKGVLLIKNKLFDSLKSKGLSLVDVKKGDEFNADDHEAVTQIPAPSKDMVGKIIDIIEKGYKLGEKVIRYPKVVIGK